MSILNRILNAYPDEGLIKVEGFDDAIIGLSSDLRMVYSLDKIIEILMDDMDEDEAIEHFSIQIEGHYLGGKAPIYVKLIN